MSGKKEREREIQREETSSLKMQKKQRQREKEKERQRERRNTKFENVEERKSEKKVKDRQTVKMQEQISSFQLTGTPTMFL